MSLVSIIVPVYNVEPYIETCIQSLIRQTMGNIEVILVDDGSTDRSGELCDQYAEADERIRVIHKQNGGLSSARNAGISAAKGEYLLFVDSDDYVSASLVEKTVSCAEQNQMWLSLTIRKSNCAAEENKQEHLHCLPGRSSMQRVFHSFC